jgi:hypothetical protein
LTFILLGPQHPICRTGSIFGNKLLCPASSKLLIALFKVSAHFKGTFAKPRHLRKEPPPNNFSPPITILPSGEPPPPFGTDLSAPSLASFPQPPIPYINHQTPANSSIPKSMAALPPSPWHKAGYPKPNHNLSLRAQPLDASDQNWWGEPLLLTLYRHYYLILFREDLIATYSCQRVTSPLVTYCLLMFAHLFKHPFPYLPKCSYSLVTESCSIQHPLCMQTYQYAHTHS